MNIWFDAALEIRFCGRHEGRLDALRRQDHRDDLELVAAPFVAQLADVGADDGVQIFIDHAAQVSGEAILADQRRERLQQKRADRYQQEHWDSQAPQQSGDRATVGRRRQRQPGERKHDRRGNLDRQEVGDKQQERSERRVPPTIGEAEAADSQGRDERRRDRDTGQRRADSLARACIGSSNTRHNRDQQVVQIGFRAGKDFTPEVRPQRQVSDDECKTNGENDTDRLRRASPQRTAVDPPAAVRGRYRRSVP